MKKLIFIALMTLASGCDCSKVPKTAEEVAEVAQHKLRINFSLPSNATNIKYLDGDASKDYVMFDLVVNGTTRKIVKHVHYDRESMFEISR